jgi:predicted RNase H-like nuclease (RuvC/YqgF family)
LVGRILDMIYIGIDPGDTGAMAAIADSGWIEVVDFDVRD